KTRPGDTQASCATSESRAVVREPCMHHSVRRGLRPYFHSCGHQPFRLRWTRIRAGRSALAPSILSRSQFPKTLTLFDTNVSCSARVPTLPWRTQMMPSGEVSVVTVSSGRGPSTWVQKTASLAQPASQGTVVCSESIQVLRAGTEAFVVSTAFLSSSLVKLARESRRRRRGRGGRDGRYPSPRRRSG